MWTIVLIDSTVEKDLLVFKLQSINFVNNATLLIIVVVKKPKD